MEMNYSLNYVETTEDTDFEVTRDFASQGDIDGVLNNMLEFLRAAGFVYVTQLVAVCGDAGVEHSSNSL
jgi:hypothetical protein